MKHTFKGGVHPADYKWAKNAAIKDMPIPHTLFFALSQHLGVPAVPVVAAGARVMKGTLIAKAGQGLSAPIFSSVSGTVKGMTKRPLLNGTMGECIEIVSDGKGEEEHFPPLESPSSDEILARIREAGIVGLGGAGFPTAVKLSPKDPVDTLIINAAECEPYLTCDYRILLEHTTEFLDGVELLRIALNVPRVIIGVEANKADCAAKLRAFLPLGSAVSVVVCPVKYPQGAEKQLIDALTRRKVPCGGLPASVGVVVCNASTALAVCQAVRRGRPLVQRVLTVSGSGCKTPSNLLVPSGTVIQDIIDYCGVLEESVVKVVSGGPMMGTSLVSTAAATVKTTSCILLLTPKDCPTATPTACINCGRCVAKCPMKLSPNMIASFSKIEDWETAKKYGAMNCIQCGCCSYTCPAYRPLAETINYARKEIRERKI